jgi:hypothetical protein
VSKVSHQQGQLSLFTVERLPHRPYCTDDYEAGTWPRQLSTALQRRYIQPNPPAVRFRLLFDVDRPAGAHAWTDANLAPPNWTATNPRNGHAHVCYEIDIPILVDPFVDRAPVRFAAAIECAYRESMRADAGYAGHLCKNPMNGHWITTVFRQEGYSLPELSEYIPDLSRFNDKRTKLPEYGLGRNVSHFNRLRLWAYKAVNAYRDGDFETWHSCVQEKATEYNDFTPPMDWNEIKHTAKSVATWVWKHAPASALRFSRLQAARGAAKHERFKEEHGIVAYEREQAKAAKTGAAAKRANTEARIVDAIGTLTAKGERVSMNAVAKLLDISQQAISKGYRHLFQVEGVQLSQP